MTVDPSGSGYVDYSAPGAIPNIAVEPSYGSSSSSTASIGSFKSNRYSETNKPYGTKVNLWGNNGFYMNGPAFDPYNDSKNRINQINSYVSTWADSARIGPLNNFFDMVAKYGHTNNAGTLWAMASNGITPDTEVGKSMLGIDSGNYSDQNTGTGPMVAGSPSANQSTPVDEPGFWEQFFSPLQFQARNAFSLLSAPLEAVQGAVRGIGGALTESTGPDFNEAAGQLFSLLLPPAAAMLDGSIYKDNEFVNPWEQTNFGQQLLAMADGGGMDAFTYMTAGLDTQKATEELLQDPANAALTQSSEGMQQLQTMATALAKQKNYYSRPGWFVDETSQVGEAQRQATFDAWAIPGPDSQLTAWTLGRGIASNIGGPDWAGYGVVSGLIDATAAIYMDPLTYVPFGAIGKAVTGAATGAKVAAKYGASMRSIQKALEIADPEYASALRSAELDFFAQNGRRPTQFEIEELVGPGPELSLTDIARMDLEDTAFTVRERLKSEKVTESVSRVNVDKAQLKSLAKGGRRSYFLGQKAAQRIATSFKTVKLRGRYKEKTDLWDNYLAYSYTRDGQYSQEGSLKFMSEVLGYDDETRQFTNFKNHELFSEIQRDSYSWINSGRVNATDPYSTDLQIANELYKVGTTRGPKPKTISSEQVNSDIVSLYARSNPEEDVAYLVGQNYDGAKLSSAPEKGTSVVGVLDGRQAIFYWAGRSKPNVVQTSDPLPSEVAQIVAERFKTVLSENPVIFSRYSGETETLNGQVSKRVANYVDPYEAIDNILTGEFMTYGKLLSYASSIGLDSVLDDVLRSLPNKPVDFISGTSGVPGRGVWGGNHPNLIAYEIDNATESVGRSMRMSDNIDEALSGADLQQIDRTPIGFNTYDVDQLESLVLKGNQDAVASSEKIQGVLADSLVKADTETQALDDILRGLDEQFANPEKALRETVGYTYGLRNSRTGGLTLDEKSLRNALFGTGPGSFFANKTLESLSDFLPEARRAEAVKAGVGSPEYESLIEDAIGSLAGVTGNKWSSDTYRAVASNAIEGGGKEGLIDVLAPRFGLDVTKGSISRGIKTMDSDGRSFFRTWRSNNPVVARALGNIPVAHKINILEPNEVVDTFYMFLRQAGIRLDDKEVIKEVGKVHAAYGRADAAAVAKNSLTFIFDKIGVKLIDDIENSGVVKVLFSGSAGQARKNEIISAIKKSTKLWVGGVTDSRSDIIAKHATDSTPGSALAVDGEKISFPPSAIETDIASGTVNLPSVEQWQQATNRFVLALNRFENVGNVYDLARRFYDNFFRTSLLMFRVSYILRNSAEMQVRMYLNGNKSIISDPATMIGMTIGNLATARKFAKYHIAYKRAAEDLFKETGKNASEAAIVSRIGAPPADSALAKLFSPYKDTVLGTRFEVGLDQELAAANFVDNYFALTRQSHSLADPRVYNTGVRMGYDYNLGYGSPDFNYGWAHELIMLERSPIARRVAQTQTPEDQDNLVEWVMTSGESFDLRQKMIGYDEKFAEIFKSEEGTRQWLFDSPNSIATRILNFTNADPRLMSYIVTGNIVSEPGQFKRIANIKTNKDRISTFGTILKTHFNDGSFEKHFITKNVLMPNIGPEKIDVRNGNKLVNAFFDLANQFERLGSVGPEYRMIYWDRVADLSSGLRREDVSRALDAARTTLGPIKRMLDDGTVDNIGKNHRAFNSLKQAQKDNTGGLLTLEEIHDLAASYAAEEVTKLFYDATKRNNSWYALRLLFPFGQAWGNTIETWTKLAAKKPINIYKAQKAMNALTESGSSAIYEFGAEMGAYGQYAPGFAPWEETNNGGFFYTDRYGGTSFMFPFAGRAAALPLKVWGAISGIPTPDELPMSSPAQSLNFALGGDSLIPGVSSIGSLALDSGLLPDSDIVANLRQIVSPFGEKTAMESIVPAWFAKVLTGIGSLGPMGDALGSWLDGISTANKNKHLRDAMMILSTSGKYSDWATNDQTARRMRDDAASLAKAMLLTTGLIQNALPATPISQPAARLELPDIDGNTETENTALYTIGMLNSLFQQYRPRNGFDDSAAREEFVKDFGPAALFATIGDWKNLSRIPKSDALKWARQNPEIAKSNIDIFTLFFPNGDSSDVAAQTWIRKYGMGDKTRKTKDEIFGEIVSFLERVQRFRINSMESNGLINSAEAEAARDDLRSRYIETSAVSGTYIDKTEEMDKINAFFNRYKEIQDTDGGKGFAIAWKIREAAINKVRSQTNDPNSGLGSNAAKPIYDWFVDQIDSIENQYPDFKLLAGKFRKEWE